MQEDGPRPHTMESIGTSPPDFPWRQSGPIASPVIVAPPQGLRMTASKHSDHNAPVQFRVWINDKAFSPKLGVGVGHRKHVVGPLAGGTARQNCCLRPQH